MIDKNEIKALVIDDNEVSSLILVYMLESLDIKTDRADNGEQAINMFRSQPYQLIFVDHQMPDMDGVQTTAAIRKEEKGEQACIISLTSDVTEEIRNRYVAAGANAVYEKPIDRNHLTVILQLWFMKLESIVNEVSSDIINHEEDELIKSIIETIEDIDYATAMKYAGGTSIKILEILEVSLKDLQVCINMINDSVQNNSFESLGKGIHKLKNVFSNIGALQLMEETAQLEKVMINKDSKELKNRCPDFMKHLDDFYKQIQSALDTYHNLKPSEPEELEDVHVRMSAIEYEHSLQKTIYYINRYEYDSILKNLEILLRRGLSDHRTELMQAMDEIKVFDYEKALERVYKLKNKTDHRPV